MFVNARTDTHWQRRPTPAALEEALRRVREYADAGADGVFVPGVTAVETAVTAAAGGTPANGLLSYVEVEALNELTAGARTTAM